MKKLVLALLALMVSVGLSMAAVVTLVKYDAEKKELTVKEGDEEKTYKVTDETKLVRGEKSVPFEKAAKLFSNPKAAGKMKFEITVDKDTVTEIKMKAGKKKKDK